MLKKRKTIIWNFKNKFRIAMMMTLIEIITTRAQFKRLAIKIISLVSNFNYFFDFLITKVARRTLVNLISRLF